MVGIVEGNEVRFSVWRTILPRSKGKEVFPSPCGRIKNLCERCVNFEQCIPLSKWMLKYKILCDGGQWIFISKKCLLCSKEISSSRFTYNYGIDGWNKCIVCNECGGKHIKSKR